MKVLSIKNPWAFLIASGFKDVENRTWKTKHRGRVMIHVPQSLDTISLYELKHKYKLNDAVVARVMEEIKNTSRGAIIGEVNIIDVVENHPSIWASKGQYQWVLQLPIIYTNYILDVKGRLGIWEYKS